MGLLSGCPLEPRFLISAIRLTKFMQQVFHGFAFFFVRHIIIFPRQNFTRSLFILASVRQTRADHSSIAGADG